MITDRWQQLDRIFSDARQLPLEQRAVFVARACGGDDGLRAEVHSLLVADDESGEFMNAPALERLATLVAADGWGLEPGERLGAYTVLRLIGSGGTGEVWRARDERLGRDVAIKVLLPHVASDAGRLQRFAEEARAAGALNHSNILTVYDVGEHHGVPFLVSECLEGQSLRKRLEAGPLPADEAVAVALGIARGLAATHARGIVHRDLKPDNVFLRSDGGVKILDFGLAKLQLPANPQAGPHTMTGIIAGTAGYMAPEQVRGENVDARADLFALGVTLYEMVGGHHPFRSASTFETLHSILNTDPADLAAVNHQIQPSLAGIVMRLLKKAPEARFQSAADLAWALEQVPPAPARRPASRVRPDGPGAPSRSRWLFAIAAPALAAALLLSGWLLVQERSRQPGPVPLTQFTWTLPAGMVLDSAPIVSPNSRHVAFVGKDATGSRLFVRDMGSLEAVAIAGTEGAKQPFWSPDSTSVGFFARRHLMKVRVTGGAPVAVADAPDGRGGAWSASDRIVFGPDLIASALHGVPADGDNVEPATLLDHAAGDQSHVWPAFLPDGRHFLYFIGSRLDDRRGVYLGDAGRPALPPGAPLFRSESEAVYAPVPGSTHGALFYVVDGRIQVRRFDNERLRLAGEARTVGLSGGGRTPYHASMLSASSEMLAFAESAVPFGARLEVVSRDGARLRRWDEREAQNWPRVSPDGRHLARQRIDAVRSAPDIWVDDLERGTRVRITHGPAPGIFPVWSPDANHLAYLDGNPPGRPGRKVLAIAAADGTGRVRTLPCPGSYCEPTDWTPDGRHLIVTVRDTRGADVWMVPAEAGAPPQPLLAAAFAEHDARVSPDGRWIAYVSNESGRPEVSVRSMSGAPTRIVLSGVGGSQPVWRRDGAELFFVDPQGRLRSVTVRQTGNGPTTFGLPVELNVPRIGAGHWGTQYDVSPDGRRVYFLPRNEDPAPRDIRVVIGWRALLE